MQNERAGFRIQGTVDGENNAECRTRVKPSSSGRGGAAGGWHTWIVDSQMCKRLKTGKV